MRNLKKYLAVLVVFAMMFTIIAPAGAAASSFSYEEEAQKLNDLGLYKGVSEDEFVPALEQALNRETGAIMVLRLFGLEEEALQMSDADAQATLAKFSDNSDISSWAKKQVAYAVDNGMIVGYTDATSGKLVFKPLLPLNGKAYASMVLQQLGYDQDFTYEQATAKVAEIGGLTDEQAAVFATKAMVRDDLVGMTYGMLMAQYKDEDTTIVGRLIESEILTAEQVAAVDEALVPASEVTPVSVSVYSVTATNGTANVVLNAKPAVDPVAADFTVTQSINGATATAVTATVYSYTAADKTVVLKVPTVASATEEQKVVYSVAYKTTDAVSAAAVVVAGDAKVASVSATNLRQVNVKFSAPVDELSAETASNYTGVGTVNTAVLAEDGVSVQLNLSSTLSNDTDYTLTIKNVQNVDLTKTIPNTDTKFRVNDLTIPTVKNVTVLGNQGLLVEFSEPVQEAQAEVGGTNGNYGFVNETVTIGTPVLDSDTDNKTFTKVTLPLGSVLTAGTHTFRVNGTGLIKDFNNYSVPAQDFVLNIQLDTSSPTVSDIKALSRTEAIVTFSKAVKGFDKARVSWNLSGSNSVGTLSNEDVIKVTDSQYKVKFTGSNALPVGVSYIVISTDSNLKDYSGNTMAANFVKQVTVAADQTPTVTSISATDDKTLVVNFNKLMDKTTAETIANYTVKDANGLVKSINSLVLDATNKNKVTLNFLEPLNAGTYSVTVANVKDGINLVMPTFVGTVSPTDTTAPTIDNMWYMDNATVDNNSKDVIVIKFSEAMNTSSLSNLASYKITANGGSINSTNGDLPSGTTITVISDRLVRIVMPNTAFTAPATDDFYLGRVDGTTFKGVSDVSGNSLASANYKQESLGTSISAMNMGTNFNVKVTSNNSLEITRKSTANALYQINSGDFKVKVNNVEKTISNATLDEISTTKTGMKDRITMTFGTDTFTANDTVSVALTASNNTVDVFGVQVATGTVNASNSIAPSLKTAALNSPTEVVVTLDGKALVDTANVGVQQALANDLIISQTKTVNGTTTTTTLSAYGTGATNITPVLMGANDGSQWKITLGTALDTELPVTISTKSADFIRTGSTASSLLVANTTGIIFNNSANALVASSMTVKRSVGGDVYLTKASVANNVYFDGTDDGIAITFNRAINLDSVVSGWTEGTTVQTITGCSVSSTGVLTIPNVGSFQTVELKDGTTSLSNIKMYAKYDAGSKTLYLALANDETAADGKIKITNVELTPYSSIKSSSGLSSIDANYKPVCTAN